MKRFKNFVEWQAFGVCSAIGAKIRDRDQPHPHVVHLYFLSHNGLSHYYLYGPGFLDEHEKVHEGSKTKSLVLFIARGNPSRFQEDGVGEMAFLPCTDKVHL